jgi:hypothetical protein
MLTVKVSNLENLKVHTVVDYHGTLMVVDSLELSKGRRPRGVRIVSRAERLTVFIRESELQVEPLQVFLNRVGRPLREEVVRATPMTRRGKVKNAN